MKKIRLKIDGYNIEAIEGQNLLQAALDAGIYIPHLCYHPDLTPSGSCKLCAVEVEGQSDIVQSCETIVEEGMVVSTKTEEVNKLRMLSLELMLASHPKDCTSCDKYLNCELQALMQYMGVSHSRLRDIEKENTRIAVSDNLIKKEMQRCIQCGRCVKVCEEYRGVKALSINKKNDETYINTIGDKLMIDSDCRFCGACVEVCPTGAIQDMKGIFSKDSPKNMALVPCKNDCPAHTDIPEYIRLTKEGRYSDAVSVIREKLTFPHSLGYICTHVCESSCKRTYLNEPISIREIKKFAVENDKEETWKTKVKRSKSNGKKVAVIGGGPSGMTAAYYLVKKGYEVDVYERQTLAGGMLSYGIPKYRLSQKIVDNEINILKEEGINIHLNSNISSLDELKDKGYDAQLIALGACNGKRPPVYNKKWLNAVDAVDFCRMANEGKLIELGDTVTVYGGGNVGFDCARTAKMMGVKTVRVVCLESREAMLADKEEITAALEEGIEILNSKSMLTIEDDEEKINSLTLIDIKGFSFSNKGLELDVVDGSETVLNTDMLIFATGQQPGLSDDFGIELVKGSFAKVDDKMKTNIDGIFACGDVSYGTKSVVQAIASGRDAAINIDLYLGGDGDISDILYERQKKNPNIGVKENFAKLNRIETFHNKCEALEETDRCLQCDLRLDIQKVKYWVDPHYKKVKEVTE
ncbi:NADPH-dependent glutamate synthase beta subunit-like oxidoreductase/Pyruvate/2-oxoacid:ferredoxin oxidoreductase delta subunit [Sedimentibacter acidaminivorans]|uniref:NADPH-dependent glutamate synthase beta subunit-like oxidoreductase/Pyruvate/2-oxoacid:ferredoxin oxidoreductase delta subunit n=1 Tax=Sedimentibacter acidaminivorans TaxID=913099 RepID=A0ABS4GDS9_9FIRM|nr:FAD-dependent oxidoreductase [Sedimentibacter acidaminivorans]MBP1925802.1 NADPH-dependent glutamate synthase beta subunit-like oxidoreductase/Pyruvate/2-oxoacid:ferredoxin oxidoreductase delta subunit [Sedimentibacter acidaminivorans]